MKVLFRRQLALQGRGQHVLQPSFRLAPPIDQSWTGDPGQARGFGSRRHILQGQIGHRIRQRLPQLSGGIGDLATADHGLALPCRVFQVGGKQREFMRPLSLIVKSQRFHATSMTAWPEIRNPYFNA
ncbi:MAG: hypothetical protein WAO35_18430 [Terriglobia bacterium]